jgi:HEAT repeat protein
MVRTPRHRREPGYAHLARLRDENDLDSLAGYLKDQTSRRARVRVVTYIASTKPGGGKASTAVGSTDPAIVPILAPILESDPERSVRRAAAYGLRRTGDDGAEKALLRALSDEDKATRIHAAMGLGDLRSRRAVDPLSRLLDDRSCAEAAANALVEIGDERALASLKAAASSAKSRRRRKRLATATVELERRVGRRPAE